VLLRPIESTALIRNLSISSGLLVIHSESDLRQNQ
jgi:hypothetical protein